MEFHIEEIGGIGEYKVNDLFAKNGAFLIDRKKTVEVRTDRNLSKLLREQYESVMVSRYFGNGGIEIVMSGQIPLEEIYDMARLSYNLTKELE